MLSSFNVGGIKEKPGDCQISAEKSCADSHGLTVRECAEPRTTGREWHTGKVNLSTIQRLRARSLFGQAQLREDGGVPVQMVSRKLGKNSEHLRMQYPDVRKTYVTVPNTSPYPIVGRTPAAPGGKLCDQNRIQLNGDIFIALRLT